jgi:hypothetical protein
MDVAVRASPGWHGSVQPSVGVAAALRRDGGVRAAVQREERRAPRRARRARAQQLVPRPGQVAEQRRAKARDRHAKGARKRRHQVVREHGAV